MRKSLLGIKFVPVITLKDKSFMIDVSVPLDFIPPWVIVAGIVLSIVVSIVGISRFLWEIFRVPVLEVRLTKECFFRLTQFGENLFANAVLMAKKGSIETRNVRFLLVKTGEGRKEYPLNPICFGEKIPGPNSFAEHNFYTQSPIAFIPENIPQRIVYMNVFGEYEERIKKCLDAFFSKLVEIKDRYRLSLGSQESEDEVIQEIYGEFNNLIERSSGDIFDLVQLEPGNYELNITVDYKPTKRLFRQDLSSAKSQISFYVDENFRNLYKANLKNTLTTSGLNFILNRNDNFMYPQYNPVNASEI